MPYRYATSTTERQAHPTKLERRHACRSDQHTSQPCRRSGRMQTMAACKAAVAKSGVDPKEIGAIGFSTQRSVTIPVDKAGKPVHL